MSQSRSSQIREQLVAWVDARPEWHAAGAPYAVFWNGPFTPWFMRRNELIVPIEWPADAR